MHQTVVSYLHSNDATVIDAVTQKLLAMKTENDSSLAKFTDSFRESQQHKGVQIIQNDGDYEKFWVMKGQFLQSLLDNFEQHFPASEFMQAAAYRNRVMWIQEPLQRALFGENFVAQMCRRFGIHIDAAASVVVDYAVYKQRNGDCIGRSLKQLVDCLQVVLISSADSEHRFSQMNLYHTSRTNRVLVNSLSDLLNGLPLEAWRNMPFRS